MALLILVVLFFLLFLHGAAAQESEDVPSTAWKDGHFHVDVAGVVRRSAYDADDHLHPNDAGMQAIADTIRLRLFSTSVKGGAVRRP